MSEMHIKTLAANRKGVAHMAAAGFLSLSERSFTIRLTPYNRKLNGMSASLNETFPSILPH